MKMIFNVATMSLLLIFGVKNVLVAQQTVVSSKGAKGYVYDTAFDTSGVYISANAFKKVPSGKRFAVLGLRKLKSGVYYDAYMVEYKGKQYVIPHEYVECDSILQMENIKLDSVKNVLFQEKSALETQFKACKEEFPLRKASRMTVLSKQIDSINKEIILIDSEARYYADSISKEKMVIEKAEYLQRLKAIENSYPQRIVLLNKKIIITKNYLHSPNSAGGCDYSFVYTNVSGKTIKYLTWEGNAYNAVGDVVTCDIRDNHYIAGKDTGPYENNDTYCGGTWDCVIYRYSAKKIELTSIDIEYMDGTRNSFTLRKGDGARIEGYRLRLAEAKKNHNAKLKRIMNEYTFIKEKKMDDNGYKSKQQHLMELNKELKALRNAESDILMHELSEKVLMAKKRYEYFISTGQLVN